LPLPEQAVPVVAVSVGFLLLTIQRAWETFDEA